MIERQTAKLPSDTFLWAAGASIIGSLVLKSMKRETDAAVRWAMGPYVSAFRDLQQIRKDDGHRLSQTSRHVQRNFSELFLPLQ